MSHRHFGRPVRLCPFSPVATARHHRREWLSAHGDGDGDGDVLDHLRITDRIKDLFIVGGFNCYPAES